MSDAKPMMTIIFRAPNTLLSALDCVANELHQTRSSLIREALGQRIAFYEKHEREIVQTLNRQTQAFYGEDDPLNTG